MASDPIQFGGEELFAAPPDRVFGVLTDLDVMAATVPDLVSSERPDAKTLKCVVKPRFSFLRATLRLTISLADIEPPRSATMRIAGQGIGVSVDVSSALTVEPAGSGTRLRWTARVDHMGGLMASVPSGLITGAADKIIRQGWQKVRERLGEGTTT